MVLIRGVIKKPATTWVFVALLSVFGLLLLSLGWLPYSAMRSRIDRFSGDGSADPYTPELHLRLQWIFIVLGGTINTLLLLVLVTGRTTWGQFVFEKLKRLRLTTWEDIREIALLTKQVLAKSWSSILIIAIFALVLRAPNLGIPIRFDEAFSWREYSSKPIWITVSLYTEPNNHVFYNVLTGLVITVFGDSIIALRIVSIVSGIVSIVLASLLASRLVPGVNSKQIAFYVTGIAMAIHPASAEYSVYARGYSLLNAMMLISACMLVVCIQKRNFTAGLLSTVAAALGMWAVPTMLYGILAIVVCVLVIRSEKAATPLISTACWMAVWLALVVAQTIVLYSPILIVSGYRSITANPYVIRLKLSEWMALVPGRMNEWYAFLLKDISTWAIPVLCLVILANGLNKQTRLLLVAAFASLALIGLMVLTQGLLPPPRTWAWIATFGCILLGTGASCIVHMFEFSSDDTTKKARFFLSRIGVIAVVILISISPATGLLDGRTFQQSNEGGACPSCPMAAKFLSESTQQGDPIIAACPASGTMDYASRRVGISAKRFDPWTHRVDEISSVIVAVVQGFGQKQSVESVIAAYSDANPFQSWQKEQIWSHEELTLFRLSKKQ